ncbi:MAG: HEAT repeat domain-containing protein [Planctomycetota bacterium]
MTDLFFCNLCDQSVPVAKLEAGDAVRHGGRVICPTCCDAMSMAMKMEGGKAKGSSMILPLLLALIASAGVVFVYLQMDKVRTEMTVQVNDAKIDLHRSLSSSSDSQSEGLAGLEAEVLQIQESVAAGFDQGSQETAAVASSVRELGGQMERLEGLADGQATLQQTIRTLQAQLQVHEDGIRETRTGQQFLRDGMADLERKIVVATAAPPKEQGGFSSEVQGLVDKLKDDDPLQRVSAIEKLSKFEDPALIPFVEGLLEDSYEMNRFYAANTLGNWEAMASVPALIAILNDDFAFVRKEANAALVKITKEDMGYDSKAGDKEREKAIEQWADWWKANGS